MENNAEEVIPIKVKDGVTIELCLAQYWNGIGDALVNMKVSRTVIHCPCNADRERR
jgi:hypothetical protein